MAAAATTTKRQPSIYAHEEELRRFFRSRESELGITSTTGAVIARIVGGTDGTSHDHDGRMVALVDRQNTIGTFRRTWRALRRMEDRGESGLVVVLHLLLGHTREPDYPAGIFGSVAAIVHLTDAAESERAELAACDSGDTMHALESGVFSTAEVGRRRDGLAEAFWREAGRHARATRILAKTRACHAEGRATATQVYGAKATADASWHRLGVLLREYNRDTDAVRALVGACVHADRSWSSRDAVKYRLTYHGPREPDGKPVRAEMVEWTRRRDEWVRAVRAEAESLYAAALTAYLSARQEVA